MARITPPGGPTPSIQFVFDVEKAGELAAHLIQFSGGSMPLMKLLKLMYLVDRQSLIETGVPVTGDAIYALPKGPVLSRTYDSLKPGGPRLPYVRPAAGEGVQLVEAPPADGQLSDYEINLARRAFDRFGHRTGKQLSNLLHKAAPEWQPPPPGSHRRMDPADILRAAGKSQEEIDAVREQARYLSRVEQLLA